jgi:DNA-binding beta-propeller fold protein YncE
MNVLYWRPRVLTSTPKRSSAVLTASVLAVAFLSWACKRQAGVQTRPYVAFVADQQGNTVAAVDLDTLQMAASIPVPASPQQLAARPRSRELYVVSASGKLSVITFPDLRVGHIFRIGPSASGLVFSPDGRRAYILAPDANQLVFLDCQHQKELGRVHLKDKPSSVCLTPDGMTLIVSASSGLYFVNAETRAELGSVRVGAAPGPMAVRPDGREVFVADTGENQVSAVQIPSRRLLANLDVAAPVSSLSVKPDGGEIFALSSQGSVIIIFDAFHDDVERTLTAGLHPVAGIFRSDMSVFYIATAGDGNITALDVQTRNVDAVAHAGTQPVAMALTPDESFLAVADVASSSLAILRTDKLGLVTAIPVGASPVDVAIPNWLK